MLWSNFFHKLQRSETFVAFGIIPSHKLQRSEPFGFGFAEPFGFGFAEPFGVGFAESFGVGFAEPFGFGFAELFGVRCSAPMPFLFVIGYKGCGALRLKSVSF